MRVTALVKRIIRQMLRDKRALALMMVAPLLIITLLHYLFSVESEDFRIGVTNADYKMIEQLKELDLEVSQYDELHNPQSVIIDDDLDGMVQFGEENISLTVINEQPSVSKGIQMKIQQAVAAQVGKQQVDNLAGFVDNIQSMLPEQAAPFELEQVTAPEISTTYVYGDENTVFFDQLSPILVGFFVFFFVFLISGISLLRERTTGTLERLFATPIRRSDIVFGYLTGYGIFAIIQTFIVVFYAVKVLDITLLGSFWNVVLINIMLALVALSLGILLSAFANSEFQMMQFIPIAIIPQIFFAGILPVDGMAEWLQVIAKLMPMYYGGTALVEVMYKGLGLSDIMFELLILLGFALLFIVLNVFALKKYRKI